MRRAGRALGQTRTTGTAGRGDSAKVGARSVCRPWGAAVSKDLGLGAGRSRPRVTAARAPTTADRAPRHDLAGPTAAGRLRATVSLRSVEHEHPAFPVSPIARLALRKVGVLLPTAAGGAGNSGKPGRARDRLEPPPSPSFTVVGVCLVPLLRVDILFPGVPHESERPAATAVTAWPPPDKAQTRCCAWSRKTMLCRPGDSRF